LAANPKKPLKNIRKRNCIYIAPRTGAPRQYPAPRANKTEATALSSTLLAPGAPLLLVFQFSDFLSFQDNSSQLKFEQKIYHVFVMP
jgi:hypothetical protein